MKPINLISKPIYFMRLLTDPIVDFTLDYAIPFIWSSLFVNTFQSVAPEGIQQAAQQIIETLSISVLPISGQEKQLVDLGSTLSMDVGSDGFFIKDLSIVKSLGVAIMNRWHQFAMERTGLDRVACVLVGYAVVILLGSWYLDRPRAPHERENSVQIVLRQQGVFLKVLFFITIELVLFPTYCGFLLDFVASTAFADASRWTFYQLYPYTSVFMHWFLGTGFLVHFAGFITISREIIRPGVMWFVRDPNDPQFHPIQEMADRPMPRLLKKITQSILMYTVVVLVCVGVSTVMLTYGINLFPLRLLHR